MARDDDAPAIRDRDDIRERARWEFIDRLVRENGIRLSYDGFREWDATFKRTVGQFIDEMTDKHEDKDVWGDTDVQMFPAFIMNRIDAIARLLPQAPEAAGRSEVRTAARTVIEDADTTASCIAMLREYDAVLGVARFRVTPICKEGRKDTGDR